MMHGGSYERQLKAFGVRSCNVCERDATIEQGDGGLTSGDGGLTFAGGGHECRVSRDYFTYIREQYVRGFQSIFLTCPRPARLILTAQIRETEKRDNKATAARMDEKQTINGTAKETAKETAEETAKERDKATTEMDLHSGREDMCFHHIFGMNRSLWKEVRRTFHGTENDDPQLDFNLLAHPGGAVHVETQILVLAHGSDQLSHFYPVRQVRRQVAFDVPQACNLTLDCWTKPHQLIDFTIRLLPHPDPPTPMILPNNYDPLTHTYMPFPTNPGRPQVHNGEASPTQADTLNRESFRAQTPSADGWPPRYIQRSDRNSPSASNAPVTGYTPAHSDSSSMLSSGLNRQLVIRPSDAWVLVAPYCDLESLLRLICLNRDTRRTLRAWSRDVTKAADQEDGEKQGDTEETQGDREETPSDSRETRGDGKEARGYGKEARKEDADVVERIVKEYMIRGVLGREKIQHVHEEKDFVDLYSLPGLCVCTPSFCWRLLNHFAGRLGVRLVSDVETPVVILTPWEKKTSLAGHVKTVTVWAADRCPHSQYTRFMRAHKRGVDAHSVSVDAHSVSVDAHSVSVDAHSVSVDAHSVSVDAHTRGVDAPEEDHSFCVISTTPANFSITLFPLDIT